MGFAIECYENGILTKADTAGLELRWGNDRAIVALTEKIAKREGLGDLLADGVKRTSEKIGEGEIITIDGSTGNVYVGRVPTVEPEFDENLETLLEWADDIRVLGGRANADTPEDAARARRFGAEGIGLCRTERMFNAADRLPTVIDMILADSEDERMKAIRKLFPMQKADFKEILKAMEGLPVTIRLLDPPLHEFLPSVEELTLEIERLRELHRILKAMEEIPDTILLLLNPMFFLPSLREMVKVFSLLHF